MLRLNTFLHFNCYYYLDPILSIINRLVFRQKAPLSSYFDFLYIQTMLLLFITYHHPVYYSNHFYCHEL